MSLMQQILATAKKEADDGYKEGTNNDNKFGQWYGINHQPWCAIFVSWCYWNGGSHSLAGIQSPKGFHNCTTALKFFKTKNQLVPTNEAQPGDIVFFNFDNTVETSEHVGIVYVNKPEEQTLITFEGNTSNKTGSANGDGVYKMKRPYNKVIGVARVKETT